MLTITMQNKNKIITLVINSDIEYIKKTINKFRRNQLSLDIIMEIDTQDIQEMQKTLKTDEKIRCHYGDIRNRLEVLQIIKNLDRKKDILRSLYECRNYLNNIFKLNLNCLRENIFNKIKNRYANENIKKIAQQMIEKVEEDIQIAITQIDLIACKNSENIEDDLKILKHLMINICSYITDIYIIRRILDKNYMKNIVITMDIYHLTNIYEILDQENFKIIETNLNEKQLKEFKSGILIYGN